jgi:uncharacterized protein involved in type VI secretion and phage assembly
VTPKAKALRPTIKVKGRALDDKVDSRLLRLHVERGLGLVGRATMTFRDDGFDLSDSDTFALGVEVQISLEAAGPLFYGTITGIDVERPRGQVSELVVVVDDAAFKMARGTQVATYLNLGYSDIIRQMAKRHNLDAMLDPMTTKFEYVLQNGTDLAFLNSIAERVGMSWWVEGQKTLHVKHVKTASPSVTLTYGENLYQFSVRASGLRPTEVEVNGWNVDQQANVNGKNRAAMTSAPDILKNYVGTKPASSLTAAKATLDKPSPMTAAEATDLADALFGDYAAAAVIARGACAVTDAIEPGGTIAAKGVGKASGNYLVTTVEHVYTRSGFETRFTAGPRRPAGLVDMLGQPPADPGFVVPGLVIGVITDNGDKAGRVKVKYVGVGGEITSPWARVVTLGGGKQRGVLFQPEVDDEVLVGFENGDTRRPVVIGGLFSEKNALPTAGSGVEEGKVGYRRITSRKNHVIELADGEGAEKQHVLIQLGTAQHKLRLGADRFDIEVANGKPLTIKAGSAMFDINASGNISIEGKNVTIKADNTLSLQGGPKVAVESNGQLQVQGATVDVKSNGTANVQASGPLALKGATVAIN